MGSRSAVLDTLGKLGFGYAFVQEEERRARAMVNAARILKKIPDLRAALDSGELAAIRGIGAGTLAVVRAVLDDTLVPGLAELEARIPAGLFEARRLRGLGPKRLKLLHDELGVTSVGEIEYACNENRLAGLPGLGAKTQAKVLDAIHALRESTSQYRMDQAWEIAQRVIAQLGARDDVADPAPAGRLRRGMEVVSEIAVVAHIQDPQIASVASALGADVEDRGGVTTLCWRDDGVPIALGVAPFTDVRGVVSLWLTGAPAHVRALQRHADTQGALLGPLGLYVAGRRVATDTEEAVYAALDLHPTPPERREADVPLVHVGKARPELVTRGELRGALHNHTTASDGIHSLAQMRAAATAAGLSYLGISDHSQTAAYAGGLEASRLAAQVAEIARANAAGDGGCVLLSGVESDILADGSLDYPAAVLRTLDVVVASVHNRYGQRGEPMTDRMCGAALNPWTDVIGHPTGRLLLGRPATEYDVEALLDACVVSGCAVEHNANPQRLDLNERYLAMAKERGVLVSIAADAHSTFALDHLRYGVTIARRAGLRAEDVLNCKKLAQLRDWLDQRKRRARGAER